MGGFQSKHGGNSASDSRDNASLHTEIRARKLPIEPFDYRTFKLLDDFETMPPLFVTEDYQVHHNVQYEESSSRGHTVRIAKDAGFTCNSILAGFGMATTSIILFDGAISHNYFANTKNAREIQASLKTNSKLWKDKSTSDARLLNQLDQLLSAIENEDYVEILKIYYLTQHRHTFNAEDKLYYAPVYVCPELNPEWLTHIKNAIDSISNATPGINLFTTEYLDFAKIVIGVSTTAKANEAFTVGSIHDSTGAENWKCFIHLGNEWDTAKMKGTSLHELMHALGFCHEFQRFDVDMYLNVKKKETSCDIDAYTFLTRFDPFSVMMYSESRGIIRMEGDPIWQLKPTGERHQELSELNKVALNLRFKPCKNTIKEKLVYNPKIDEQMGMLYCGREVMLTHNQDGKSSTDVKCGPNNVANCPSCRVILWTQDTGKERRVIPKLKRCLNEGKWQGLSGFFYCGKPDPNSSYFF